MAMTDLFLSRNVVAYIHFFFSKITSVFDWPSIFVFSKDDFKFNPQCGNLQRTEAVVFIPHKKVTKQTNKK